MTHRSRAGGPPKPTYGSRGRTKPTGTGAVKGAAPRKIHHPPPAEPSSSTPTSSTHPLRQHPADQDILDVLHEALKITLDSEDFIPLVQKVKGLLYEKRWLDVFERPEDGWLEAYAGRWVPGRVLCFRDLLGSVPAIRELLLSTNSSGARVPNGSQGGDSDDDEDDDEEENEESSDERSVSSQKNGNSASSFRGVDGSDAIDNLATSLETANLEDPLQILSLGGGSGSEYLAFAALLAGTREIQSSMSPSIKGKERAISWTGVDLGAWDGVLSKLEESVQARWTLPLELEYIRTNLLDTPETAQDDSESSSSLPTILRTRTPQLITILYTLTELFTQSRVLTFSLLSSLSSHCTTGTLLLVADSASDISEFELGKEGRKWPVYMILDMMMLAPKGGGPAWEVVEKSDSRWYRLPPGVGGSWPTKLENTRYWYRLYRRI